MKKIRLSIEEILDDFENIIRYDEWLNVLSEKDYIKEENLIEFRKSMEDKCNKYIPNYKNLLPSSYNKQDENDKGIILFNMLYKNFKEIVYNLV